MNEQPVPGDQPPVPGESGIGPEYEAAGAHEPTADQAPAAASSVGAAKPGGIPTWAKVAGVAAVVLVLAFAAFRALGGSSPVEAAADRCQSQWPLLGQPIGAFSDYVTVGDDGSSATMNELPTMNELREDTPGEDVNSWSEAYRCMLRELDTPDSVFSQMENTATLGGTQTTEAKGIQYTWRWNSNSATPFIMVFSEAE
jgi:hypothetical protein